MKMLRTDKEYQGFVSLIADAMQRHPLELFSFCVLSDEWHFVVRPKADGDLTAFFRWLTNTHAVRWRVAHRTVGHGHLYQGRYKSFPVQADEHFLNLCRYVESNAVTAGLADRAELWKWGSLWTRLHGSPEEKEILSPWPVPAPGGWVTRVNAAIGAKELDRLKISIERSRPYGSDVWTTRTAAKLGLGHTIRGVGRPSKKGKGGVAR